MLLAPLTVSKLAFCSKLPAQNGGVGVTVAVGVGVLVGVGVGVLALVAVAVASWSAWRSRPV
jgi:hypothetical protein